MDQNISMSEDYEIVREGVDDDMGCVYRIEARTEVTNNQNNSEEGVLFVVDNIFVHEYDEIQEFVIHLSGRASESGREWFIQILEGKGVPPAACTDTAALVFNDIYMVEHDGNDDLAINMDVFVAITARPMQLMRQPTPASREAVAALERVDMSVGPGETACVVCLEEIEISSSSTGLKLIKLPCSHVFHGDCILSWLSNSSICPLCRFKLPEESSEV